MDITLEKLLSTIEQYNPQADMSLIIRAYTLGELLMKGRPGILVKNSLFILLMWL